MVEQSQWMKIVEANPAHSTWFVKRFRDMAAAGQDLDGEARLVDAMVPRRARIHFTFSRVFPVQKKPVVGAKDRLRPRTGRHPGEENKCNSHKAGRPLDESRRRFYCHPETSYPLSCRHRLTKLT